jgi:transcriptional regulator with XRE-family HTH domain
MSWLLHRRRNTIDAARFIGALIREFGSRDLARRCGVSDRTIRRWASGIDWPARESLEKLIDSVAPAKGGSLPLYSPDMAIDGNTRVAGVGDYTIRAARGEPCYEEECPC